MVKAPVNIDLDIILEVALKGVRRAAVFMGLGIHAALDESFKSYQLSRLSQIQLVPDDVPEETIKHFKDEFRTWIESGGLRELADTFAIYLDSVHHACLLMKSVKGRSAVAEMNKIQAKYQSQGFPSKLNTLSRNFGVSPEHSDHLVSLSRARNCLTHRRGIVGVEDLYGQHEFGVTWIGLDIFIEEPNGTRHPFTEVPQEGLLLPEGGKGMAQFVERCRRFKRGEKLQLSTRDLAEICWLYEREARGVLRSVVKYANTIGVQIKEKGV